jgi:hypothetical protein
MRQYRVAQREGLQSLRFVYIDAAPLLELLEAMDVPRSKQLDKAIWRARRSGTFTLASADELCVRYLRVHPSYVFGDAWWAA